MTREEMKPCPFCGSTDMMKRIGKGFRWNRVRCNGCKAFGPLAMYDNPDELWNTRAALAPPAAPAGFLDAHQLACRTTPPAASEPETCDHGHLRRSCELCERDAEIERLRAELSALRGGVRDVLNSHRPAAAPSNGVMVVTDFVARDQALIRLVALVEGK